MAGHTARTPQSLVRMKLCYARIQCSAAAAAAEEGAAGVSVAGGINFAVHQRSALACMPAYLPSPGCPAAGLDLINEPRCYQCGTALQQWVQEMAVYVKSLDANHLLTVRCWAQTNRQGRHYWQLLAPMRGMCVCTTAL